MNAANNLFDCYCKYISKEKDLVPLMTGKKTWNVKMNGTEQRLGMDSMPAEQP